jgi:AraC family transcriptional regulator, transcriptional activator of pobA
MPTRRFRPEVDHSGLFAYQSPLGTEPSAARRYGELISLADVAAVLALSARHITTVVRHKTGRTVQQWITERGMRQAPIVLAEAQLTVAALSDRVGYPDVSYFIKRFRCRPRDDPGAMA